MKNNDEQPKSFEASLEALEEIVQAARTRRSAARKEFGTIRGRHPAFSSVSGTSQSGRAPHRNSAARQSGPPVVSAFEDANAISEEQQRLKLMNTSSEIAALETARTSTADLQQFLTQTRKLVDAALDRLLPAESVPPTKVHAAIRWSVFAGGKRFRPLSCSLSAKLLAPRRSANRHRLRAGNDSHLFADSRRSALDG